jgi:hypothetical protein
MLIQTFKTHCEECGEEVESKTAVLDGSNDIIIDFMDGMEFNCECGETTYIEVEKHTRL